MGISSPNHVNLVGEGGLKNNLLLNYQQYSRAVHNERTVQTLNEKDRRKLQDFVKNHSIIVPARIRGKQTSLKIRTCVAAMYVFIVGGDDVKDYKQFIMDAIHRISQNWYGEDGKGLGGFVQDTMLRECFDKEEKSMFDYIVSVLNDQCASVGPNRVMYSGYDPKDGSERE